MMWRREHAVRADGFPVFDIPPDTPPLTSEMVRDALEDIRDALEAIGIEDASG